jgi:NAD(P)-dependent dehydrogenase (short-subunit alcohol dehydrogenase family)
VVPLFRLDGQIALVTGAYGQLGTLWCQTLLEAGARVVALDVPPVPPDPLLQRFSAFVPGQWWPLQADVTDRASLETVRQTVTEHWGPVSILVNNAGIDQPPAAAATTQHVPLPLCDVPLAAMEPVIRVNTLGAVLCMQVFGEAMVWRRRGVVVNIGSLYATVSPDARFYEGLSPPGHPPFLKPLAYGASKAALANLTQYFATHWGAYGVRVNMLSPGGVEGGQPASFKEAFCQRVPLGRMATLNDLVGPLLFLVSDASRYVTGQNLQVDGGFTVW